MQKVTHSFVMSVCLSVHIKENSAPTEQILMQFEICVFFENLLTIFKFHLKSDKNNAYFTWKPWYIYDNISLNSSYNEKYFRQKL